MFGTYLLNVRKQQPHMHCMTNYVSANDCANILLALGS
ncbi:MAG: hydroxyethylthiazole kinase, partial [Oscillospiraceae bacterium]|nr:hydroxyethylthiazole kinase [Oscillospiraceae bacterium]